MVALGQITARCRRHRLSTPVFYILCSSCVGVGDARWHLDPLDAQSHLQQSMLAARCRSLASNMLSGAIAREAVIEDTRCLRELLHLVTVNDFVLTNLPEYTSRDFMIAVIISV